MRHRLNEHLEQRRKASSRVAGAAARAAHRRPERGAPAPALPAGATDGLRLLVSLTADIQASVHASRAEFAVVHRAIAEVKAELLETRRQMCRDPLTGTENRRAMDAILSREISRARRDGHPLAVAMVDLDHFKRVNDQHGHAAGDAALVHLAQLAKALLRGNDAFIRYGGEEFLLVLPETGLDGGVLAAQRLQQALARATLVHDGVPIPMTLSGGVAVLVDDDSEESLIKRADVALYRAKHAGRDRVLAE